MRKNLVSVFQVLKMKCLSNSNSENQPKSCENLQTNANAVLDNGCRGSRRNFRLGLSRSSFKNVSPLHKNIKAIFWSRAYTVLEHLQTEDGDCSSLPTTAILVLSATFCLSMPLVFIIRLFRNVESKLFSRYESNFVIKHFKSFWICKSKLPTVQMVQSESKKSCATQSWH